MDINDFKISCRKCNHEWLTRKIKEQPLKCPKCFSRDWNKKDE